MKIIMVGEMFHSVCLTMSSTHLYLWLYLCEMKTKHQPNRLVVLRLFENEM